MSSNTPVVEVSATHRKKLILYCTYHGHSYRFSSLSTLTDGTLYGAKASGKWVVILWRTDDWTALEKGPVKKNGLRLTQKQRDTINRPSGNQLLERLRKL